MNLDLKEIEEKTQVTTNSLDRIEVKTNEDNSKATECLKGVKGLQKSIKETFRPHIETAHKAWKNLISEEKKHLEPLIRCEEILKGKIGAFLQEQEAIRRKEQQKQDELARKAAERERARLEKKAEKLKSKGEEDKAEEILEEAENVHKPSILVESNVQKQEGVSTTKAWKFRIENEALVPRTFLIVDESKIRKQVNVTKGETNIPGISVYCEENVRVRV